MTFDFQITGMDQTNRMMMELPDKVERNIIKKAQREAGKIAQAAMQRNVPKRTGRLEMSIAVSGRRAQQHEAKTHIGPKKFSAAQKKKNGITYSATRYAHLVEYGTRKMRARPYARPAWDQTRDQMLEKQISMISEYVVREWSKHK